VRQRGFNLRSAKFTLQYVTCARIWQGVLELTRRTPKALRATTCLLQKAVRFYFRSPGLLDREYREIETFRMSTESSVQTMPAPRAVL